MLVPTLPTSFPAEAVTLIASKIRGNDVPLSELVTGAWIVAGYAAGLALATRPTVGASETPVSFTDEEAVTALEASCVSGSGMPTVAGINIPWALLAQWAIGKFIEWTLTK